MGNDIIKIKRFQTLLTKLVCLTVLNSLTVSVDLHAQKQSVKFKHISLEQGLSQSSVYCIVQDSKGFMWFGTEGGLNKYDGYKFTIFLSDLNNPNTLSNSFILSIYNDQSNIFWIGTERGLNRFDLSKEQFTRYINDPNNPNSLSHDRVLSICKDSFNELWIGTESGLNRFDQEKNQFIRYLTDPSDPTSLSNNFIRSIYEDKSGVLWIATNGGGLNKFDRKKNQFIHYKNSPDDPNSLSDNHVLCIYEDHSGILWIGTEDGGLNQFNRKEEKFIQYKNKPGDFNSLSDNHINAIHEDKSGVLWIGTNDGGLNIFDRKKKKIVRYQSNPDDPYSLSSNRVLSIFEDNTGGLWIGNYGGGINIFNRETRKFLHYKNEPNNPNSLSYSDVRPIYEDQEGVIWIGTDGGGLNKFDREKNIFKCYKNNPKDPYSLSDNRVFAICEDQSGLFWIGTHGGGLNKFNRKKEKFIWYKHNPKDPKSLSDNKIRVICEDQSGELWIGTNGGGLNKFDRKKEQFIHYKFDPKNPHNLNNDKIYCMFVDHSNVLWIGTFGGGLNKFDRKKEQFIHYKNNPDNPKSLSNNFVLEIYEDRSRTLWVGTLGGGISKFDREKETFTHYTKKDGLPDEVIYDIVGDDNGELWISTNRGLSRFNPKTLKFKNFDMKDGLQSNEFNTGTGLKTRSGEMFFGGINGFNAFYPDSIRDNPYVPPVVITDFQIFNKSVPVGEGPDGRSILKKSITETEEIKLSYKDQVFSFEYAVLHYVSPEKNEYAYMMEGLEKSWNYVRDRRFVTYTTLPSGDYTFKVKGSNNDGVWNEEGTSIKIHIIPPFWVTWWFRTLIALVILGIVLGWYRMRIRNIEAQKKKLEIQVAKRTEELETMDRMVKIINREIDLESVLKSLLRQAFTLLPQAEKGTFLIYDHQRNLFHFEAVEGYDYNELKEIFLTFEETVSRYTEGTEQLEKGVYIVRKFKGISAEEKLKRIPVPKSMLAMAVTLGGKLEGFLILDNMSDAEAFNRSDVQKLLRFREHAVSAITKANILKLLEEKNQSITSSIRYAERIQQAILPLSERIESTLSEHFIIFKPRDIVSGDFYWFNKIGNKVVIAVVDCTGHGVPGAFMSMIGNTLLNDIVNEQRITDPALILENLHTEVRFALKQENGKTVTQDGMDVCLCTLELEKKKIAFAGAKRPLYIVRTPKSTAGSSEFIEIKGNRKSIGGRQKEKKRSFSNNEIEVQHGDMIYLTSDGFVDQNDSEGKKYGSRRLKEFLKTHAHLLMDKQREMLLAELEHHQGEEEQRDDITMVGIRI